ncbi:MAG: GNAT family N-acetyltransferase, partial [Ruminococcaceae bacterium]|nr:GNAT family N-acetyltransferase [Oscillospiraceae bacterium]
QLTEHEQITRFAEFSPFVSALYVDERVRGYGYSEFMLNHAKYEAARLDFKKIYIATDHIGFYEKYGFREIGLDIYEWGSPAKLYEADTYSDIRFELFDRTNPMPDHLLLEDAVLRWGELPQNPAKLLQHLKHFDIFADNPANCFLLTAFKDNMLVGRVQFVQNPDNRLNWHIGDLNVKTDFRRRGIAKRLLTKGIDIIKSKASGGEFIYSDIEKDNEPSLCLHASLGFFDTGEVKPFWELIYADDFTTHILFLDNKLTVTPVEERGHIEALSNIYNRNIEPLHGGEITLEEWESFLSEKDSDEAHFLIYKSSFPAAWLKVNGLENKETGWISMLAVEPVFQKMGVGSFAVKFAEDFLRLRQKNKACICTTEDNTAAQRLYKKCGYGILENRECETGDGVKRKGLVFEKIIL